MHTAVALEYLVVIAVAVGIRSTVAERREKHYTSILLSSYLSVQIELVFFLNNKSNSWRNCNPPLTELDFSSRVHKLISALPGFDGDI